MMRCIKIILQCLVASLTSTIAQAWGLQGHRLVALIAADRLTPMARQNVAWLLEKQSLADVSSWADQYLEGNHQTFYWHFVNVPLNATSYDRDRDCPKQPGVSADAPADKWRDCVVDRILYNQGRLADASLDHADRAIALKFLVHLVGDLHQPFHAFGLKHGGNGIPVSAFGSEYCSYDQGGSYPCNLHGTWDEVLIAHRRLDDREYVPMLEEEIRRNRWDAVAIGLPAEWAMQSHSLAKAARLPPHGNVDEAYYREKIRVVEKRLALAGLRLAAVLNAIFTMPPPKM